MKFKLKRRKKVKGVDFTKILKGKKAMEHPTALSYSSISLWCQCPAAWKAKYVDKLQAPVGDAARRGNAFDQLVASRLGCPLFDHLGKSIDRPDESTELSDMLDGYFAFKDTWLDTRLERKPMAQVKVTVTPDQWAEMAGRYGANTKIPYSIIGFADLQRTMSDGVRIEGLDLKTSERMEFRSSWTYQILFYAAALGWSKSSIHLVVKNKSGVRVQGKSILSGPNKPLIKHVLDWYAHYSNEIKNSLDNGGTEDWPRNHSYGCSWCPLMETCAVGQMK